MPKDEFIRVTMAPLVAFITNKALIIIKTGVSMALLTNPYAFGFIPGMAVDGEPIRFIHAWIKYEGGTLPERYHDKVLGPNPLQNFVRMARLIPSGSTFKGIDEEKVLQTERPLVSVR